MCLLPEDPGSDDSLELLAAELCSPLNVIRLSAEGLVEQLREMHGDACDISAAERLVNSAEKMSRIVQALLEASRGELP
ncbi:MAG: HAMP domain-containing histidine kinase [Myxococcaceae bacterium]|nr:HAMP domain-containing histidine kinase [Myxococcaceae bacterium]